MRKRKHLWMIIILLFSVSLSNVLVNASDSATVSVNLEYYGPNADINHDGKVDYLDVSALVSNYGRTGEPCRVTFREDINRDGKVDYLDVSALVSNYGLTWVV